MSAHRRRTCPRLFNFAIFGTFVTFVERVQACPNCATSEEVAVSLAAHSPGSTLGILLLAFAAVGAIIGLTARFMPRARLLVGGALLLGAGLGAFLDGIVLHQVLQWHAMISSLVPPTDLVASKVNMFWDGIFHLLTWTVTVAAVVIVLRELSKMKGRSCGRLILGCALTGWGYFNVVEGLIDHHAFGLHHVHPGIDRLAWDLGFLSFGVLLIVGGAWIALPRLATSEDGFGTGIVPSWQRGKKPTPTS